ncbi:MAG: EAL domain-containing protein [Patulibacter minatonensis]
MTQPVVRTHDELTRILDDELIVSRYQPIIDLVEMRPAGFEALARGPQGSDLEFPDRLFDTAREAGRLDELDAQCRLAAIRGAAGSAIATSGGSLFINVEPGVTGPSMVATYDVLAGAPSAQGVIFEFTERALTERPADVLAAARRLRTLGAGIALDDIGVDPRSLALLSFLQPDVVKLDMRIVHGARSAHTAKVMHAVGAYAERTGAAIVAEGIETAAHLTAARSLGATHGQGWLFGRPEAPPASVDAVAMRRRSRPVRIASDGTPFGDVVRSGRPVQQGDKALILALSRQLEVQAATLGDDVAIIGNLQHERHLTPHTADRYAALASGAAFAGLIGAGVPEEPAPGVRGGAYATDDPLALEWSVTVISPHFAGAMLALDLGDRDVPDMTRRFSFCLTYDRALVSAAASALMARIER